MRGRSGDEGFESGVRSAERPPPSETPADESVLDVAVVARLVSWSDFIV
jgi:hypothetical protein